MAGRVVKADDTTATSSAGDLSGGTGRKMRSGNGAFAVGFGKGGLDEQVIGIAREFRDPVAILNGAGGIGAIGNPLSCCDVKDPFAEVTKEHFSVIRDRNVMLIGGTVANGAFGNPQPWIDRKAETV